jgi:hypothetical protein
MLDVLSLDELFFDLPDEDDVSLPELPLMLLLPVEPVPDVLLEPLVPSDPDELPPPDVPEPDVPEPELPEPEVPEPVLLAVPLPSPAPPPVLP